MSSLSRAVSAMPPTPKAIINANSAQSWNPVTQTPSLQFPAKVISVPGTTANTLSDVFNITGAGMLKFISVYIPGTTVQTLRVVLTLDGVVVFDSTSGNFGGGAANYGMTLIGGFESPTTQSTAMYCLDRVPFSKSARLQVATSIASCPVAADVMYETY